MKKIISLFRRNYDGDRLVRDEITTNAEWVVAGEGVPTVKYDGTCCMVRNSRLFKRYDRKMIKRYYKRLKSDPRFAPSIEHFKSKPNGWEAAEKVPDMNTGHWPGWLPVGDGPEDRWHKEAFEVWKNGTLPNGTYELIGPKIAGNPYGNETHRLIPHGRDILDNNTPRDFDGLCEWFKTNKIEGIVWHHPDGRMVKIKRRDFGYSWP